MWSLVVQILCDASDYNLPVFNNLTSLTFDGELWGDYYVWPAVQLLLCQAPKLQTLAFEMAFTGELGDYDDYPSESCMKKPLNVPECLSSHLTICYYKGFSGHEVEMELVRQVLKEAYILKTMNEYYFCKSSRLRDKASCLQEIKKASKEVSYLSN